MAFESAYLSTAATGSHLLLHGRAYDRERAADVKNAVQRVVTRYLERIREQRIGREPQERRLAGCGQMTPCAEAADACERGCPGSHKKASAGVHRGGGVVSSMSGMIAQGATIRLAKLGGASDARAPTITAG